MHLEEMVDVDECEEHLPEWSSGRVVREVDWVMMGGENATECSVRMAC